MAITGKRTLVLAGDFDTAAFLRQRIPELRKESYVVNSRGEISRNGHVMGYVGYLDRDNKFQTGVVRPDKSLPAVRVQLINNSEQAKHARNLVGHFYDAEREGTSFKKAREIVIGELEEDEEAVVKSPEGKVVDLTKLL